MSTPIRQRWTVAGNPFIEVDVVDIQGTELIRVQRVGLVTWYCKTPTELAARLRTIGSDLADLVEVR